MVQATERLVTAGALLRLDPKSGTLKERKYVVSIISGPDAGKSLPIEGSVKVGSHPQAQLLLTDTAVSRYHVELQARPDGVRVKDLESTNGTYLGGTRVNEVIVEDEAVLSVGKTQLRISLTEQDLGLPAAQNSFGSAIGTSAAMRQLFGILDRVAPTDSTVLLLGETGTGKEVMAESIHHKSKRSRGPFVVVDCGAVAPTLIESELFGHVRGSFTGAVGDRNGAFIEADGGTIFLDELGELPLDLQPKLLRVLESGAVRRVGEDKYRRVDVRVIAATHRNLDKEIEAGRFRRDLFYRLAVVNVSVPPLRDRLDDIPQLTSYFVHKMGRGDFELPRGLLQRFAAYHWPGNVRELRNLVERALAGADIDPVPISEVPTSAAAPKPLGTTQDITDLPFKEAKERLIEGFTREYLESLLEKCDGNISKMAREAGIARNYVHRLVTKYGLKATE